MEDDELKISKMEEENSDQNEGKQEQVQQRELPHDVIIHHILPFQSIKSLTQYKLVSKQWYSSLTSPNFILHYTKQPLFSHPGSPVETLFIQTGNNFYLYSCENDDNVEVVGTKTSLVKLRNVDIGHDVIYLVGSSNGLICLGEIYGKFFILWNPITSQSHKYYSQECESLHFLSDFVPHISWGFGYVSSSNDHKVVKIIQYRKLMLIISVVFVFSLKSNSWRKIELVSSDEYSPLDRYVLVERPRLVNETLFWTTICTSDDSRNIVAFDLALETFDMFPQLTMRSPLSDTLCVMDGCISKCQVFDSLNVLLIDIVKCPGRVVSVRLPCDLSWGGFNDLIGFTKTGKLLVAYSNPRKLGLIDLRAIGLMPSSRKSLAKFRYQGRTRIESFVPSQISPLPPTEFSDTLRQIQGTSSVESILQRAKEERDTAVRQMQQLQQELKSWKRRRSNSGFSCTFTLIVAMIGLMLGFLSKLSLPLSSTA